MNHFPHQPSHEDAHQRDTTTRHHVLYPNSSGQKIEVTLLEVLRGIWEEQKLNAADFPIIELEHPADMAHGDWATNVAMKLARPLKQNPRQIATEIVTRLDTVKIKPWSRVEVAGPGFINFFLSDDGLLRTILDEIENLDKRYGQTQIRQGRKVMIEHTQPNSHKALHIGHLRNSVLGMAQVRLHRAIGYEVKSVTYGGDVGPHIAKCLWGLQHGNYDLESAQTLDEKVELIQQAYILGTQAAADNPEVETEIKRLNKVIYEQSDPEVMAIYERTRDWSIEKQKQLYARVGTEFDRYYWESEVWKRGLQEVRDRVGGVFVESEGAVIFDGEKYGLHKRVFITSQGTAPYEAKDLGLILLKMDEYDFDYCIIQTGNDHIDYFKVLICAFEQIHPEYAGKIQAEHFGLVNIPSGKMSSRHGNVVLAEDVLDEMKARALKTINDRRPEATDDSEGKGASTYIDAEGVEQLDLVAAANRRPQDMSLETRENLAEQIGQAATKFALLKYDPKQDIVFDPDVTMSFTGESGPYLQYVCVRISGIAAKAMAAGKSMLRPDHAALLRWIADAAPEERILLRKLGLLPEVIIRSALEYKVNYLTTYLFDVAQAFNDFYQACPVLKAEPEIRQARAALCDATEQVLRNGLALLGIAVPERM